MASISNYSDPRVDGGGVTDYLLKNPDARHKMFLKMLFRIWRLAMNEMNAGIPTNWAPQRLLYW